MLAGPSLPHLLHKLLCLQVRHQPLDLVAGMEFYTPKWGKKKTTKNTSNQTNKTPNPTKTKPSPTEQMALTSPTSPSASPAPQAAQLESSSQLRSHTRCFHGAASLGSDCQSFQEADSLRYHAVNLSQQHSCCFSTLQVSPASASRPKLRKEARGSSRHVGFTCSTGGEGATRFAWRKPMGL